ncbi:hypothetical protein [Pseudomonas syringae]|uniref:hypothetical protein n=1 Tax=Pseudomonas syringae TaxID=317 RepID=UPI00190FBA7F|nr:hypothetical protein [Pseudomonas syringae]
MIINLPSKKPCSGCDTEATENDNIKLSATTLARKRRARLDLQRKQDVLPRRGNHKPERVTRKRFLRRCMDGDFATPDKYLFLKDL